MPEINIKMERHFYEMDEYLVDGDGEGCGANLPLENQLDSFLKKYLSSLGGKLVREISPIDFNDEHDWLVSFWNIGNIKLKLRYFRINEDEDWPCSYPQTERVTLKA